MGAWACSLGCMNSLCSVMEDSFPTSGFKNLCSHDLDLCVNVPIFSIISVLHMKVLSTKKKFEKVYFQLYSRPIVAL